MVNPSPNSQYTQQFLSSVLSQRGPTALPYTEDTKWLIRQHLLNLSETFPSLDPKTAAFTHNDGRSVHLLQADGTIPVTFQAVTYNIPIIIWLLDSYPRHPPCVYVNPTRDMIIKRPHPHVNPSGLVSLPYLHNWVYPSSNLVDLVKHLSAAFGRDPPLYSQRRPNSSNPSEGFRVNSVGGSVHNVNSVNSVNLSGGSVQNPNSGGGSMLNSVNSMNLGGGSGHNPNSGGGLMSNSVNLGSFGRPGVPPPRGYPPQLSHPPYGGRPVTEDPTEVYKRMGVCMFGVLVHGVVGEMRREREGEVEGLFNLQAVLRRRGEEVSKGLREMLEEKEALEQELQIVLMNGDVLEGWLRDNKGKKLLGGVENVDDVFECVDVLSKQMLECTASDLAIEDTIDSLDKAVQMGVVPFDQYLRSVRALSREQFFQRATASKVRAAQLQAQVANMAARNAHYGR